MDAPECQGCRELQKRVAELEARLRELEARLGQTSSNSSLPPSLNPPGAPKPVVKAATGRKPGGQPGHRGYHRRRLPPERVTQVVEYKPDRCEHCQAALSKADKETSWHQVAELPPTLAEITEHRGYASTCRCCGHVTRAAIPAPVRASRFGARLTALVTLLTGRCHLGKRTVVELLETVFGVPLALGSVTPLEQEMSAALQPAYDEAVQAVRQAPHKHADETGWKQAGRLCWLWGVATKTTAAFLVHPSRGREGLTAFLEDKPSGFVSSDRWHAYGCWPVRRRQLCWAHLKRDFQKLADRGGKAAKVGTQGLQITHLLFDAWHLFRGGTRSRRWLQKKIAGQRRKLRKILKRGSRSSDLTAVRFCRRILKLEPALWTFARVEGIEPTNNHAERVLRQAVLWRKNSFGCHSQAGCRFAERILTAVQTLRMQGSEVLNFLYNTLIAHRLAHKAPKLVLAV